MGTELVKSSFVSLWVMGVQRMRNQLAAAERKAKKAATAAEAGSSGATARRAKKGAKKTIAAQKPEEDGDTEAGPSGADPQVPSSEVEQDAAPLDADAATGAPSMPCSGRGCGH